jgi:hypothetical protein
MSLVSYHDLTTKSRNDPSRSYAELAVRRMQDASSPMPPPPNMRASSAEVATIQSWIAAGYPMGTCGATDGGATGGGGDSGSDPYGTPLVCTSGQHWTGGDNGSSLMHPGAACIDCHSRRGGPALVVGGTVFPTAHEPTDCYGASSAQVILVDSRNQTFMLSVGVSGNFYLRARSGSFAPPFHAKVVAGGRERAMSAAQMTGDCNSCHTVTGANQAPGRIMLP